MYLTDFERGFLHGCILCLGTVTLSVIVVALIIT